MKINHNSDLLHGIADVYTPAQLSELGITEDKSLGKTGKSVYEKVNDLLISEIEKGTLPWRKEWKGSSNQGTGQFMNYRTKRPYSGVNPWLITLKIKDHHSPYFLTLAQIQKRGGELKKDATPFQVVYFGSAIKTKTLDPTPEKPEGERLMRLIRFLKEYTVYNIADTNLDIDWKAIIPEQTEAERIENCEKVYEMMPKRPPLKHGGDRAFYAPGSDYVQMPKIEDFRKQPFYYSTLFHELIHSTGHAKRLKRDLNSRFGDNKYAFEELIAEIGASYICAYTGILFHTRQNTGAYLKSWMRGLVKEAKENKTFFFKAASQAQAASNFILSKQLVKVKKKKGKSLQGASTRTDIKKLKREAARLRKNLGKAFRKIRQFEPHTITDHVAEFLQGRRISKESFIRHGDSNHLKGKSGNLYRLHWLGDKGNVKERPLDTLVQDFQNEYPQFGFHDESEIINEMVDVITNYPAGSGAYIDDRNLQRENEQQRESERDAYEQQRSQIKPKTKRKLKKGKIVATKKLLVQTRKIYSVELALIKTFIGLDGKVINQDTIANRWKKVKSVLKDGKVSSYKSILKEIDSRLHKALGFALESSENKIKIVLDSEFKARCLQAVRDAKVKLKTEYLAGTNKKGISEMIDGTDFTKHPLRASTKAKIKNTKPIIAHKIEDLKWLEHPDGGEYAKYKLGTITRYKKSYSVDYGNNHLENAKSIKDAIKKIDLFTLKNQKPNQLGKSNQLRIEYLASELKTKPKFMKDPDSDTWEKVPSDKKLIEFTNTLAHYDFEDPNEQWAASWQDAIKLLDAYGYKFKNEPGKKPNRLRKRPKLNREKKTATAF